MLQEFLRRNDDVVYHKCHHPKCRCSQSSWCIHQLQVVRIIELIKLFKKLRFSVFVDFRRFGVVFQKQSAPNRRKTKKMKIANTLLCPKQTNYLKFPARLFLSVHYFKYNVIIMSIEVLSIGNMSSNFFLWDFRTSIDGHPTGFYGTVVAGTGIPMGSRDQTQSQSFAYFKTLLPSVLNKTSL